MIVVHVQLFNFGLPVNPLMMVLKQIFILTIPFGILINYILLFLNVTKLLSSQHRVIFEDRRLATKHHKRSPILANHFASLSHKIITLAAVHQHPASEQAIQINRQDVAGMLKGA